MSAIRPIRVTAPAVSAVELHDVKPLLRLLAADDDAMLLHCITAALAEWDGWSGMLNRALINQEWRQTLPSFPAGDFIQLALPDVSSVHVTYRDVNDLVQTLSTSKYSVVNTLRGGAIALNVTEAWPSIANRLDAVTITYVAGFGASKADVPADIRLAIADSAIAAYHSAGRDPLLKSEQIPGVQSIEYAIAGQYGSSGLSPRAMAAIQRHRHDPA